MAKLYKRYVIHGHNLDFFCFLVDIIIKLVFCGNFIEIIRAFGSIKQPDESFSRFKGMEVLAAIPFIYIIHISDSQLSPVIFRIMIWTYIFAPLVGGVIGYVTNDIAIRMLFRPHTAKHIMGWRIPFTPGIIPKEKGRIAEAVGTAISDNLMSQEVLEKYLLSDHMLDRVRTSIEDFIAKQKGNSETVAQFLEHYLSREEVAALADNVKEDLTRQMHDKLSSPELGRQVAKAAMAYIAEKMNAKGAEDILSEIGGLIGELGMAAKLLFTGSVINKFLELLREPVERFLAKNVNEIFQKNGDGIIANLVGSETDKFLAKPVKELLAGQDAKLADAVSTLVSIYKTTITEHLPKILESIDIRTIVRERINEMDMNETEVLILQVMNKELRAIVWLGALLGTLMGCTNFFL